MDKSHCLYLILGERNGVLEFKIGQTWNIALRLAQHKNKSGRKNLIVLKTWKSDRESVVSVERSIHEKLQPYAIVGKLRKTEWYPAKPEIFSTLRDMGLFRC